MTIVSQYRAKFRAEFAQAETFRFIQSLNVPRLNRPNGIGHWPKEM